ncbi:hypothetical protein SO802_018949 [Lithocarpus litseifolius]|uniref:Nodulin-like domain-containing protein n=1 Tax=Lithocarpus litseifolius TaxID=425828 RepID=A0AAW2CM89_9ROSI
MAELKSCGLARHLVTGRWTSVFASFLIMAGAGATYLFAVYSSDIKKNLGYNQTMLNTMSSCKDIGASVGIVSGLIAEITPTWFILLLGSLTNFVGYFMIWLAVTGRIAKPQFWQCVSTFSLQRILRILQTQVLQSPVSRIFLRVDLLCWVC